MDTTGTKHFVLYSEVSFVQGVVIEPSYNRDQLCWSKAMDHESVVLTKDI